MAEKTWADDDVNYNITVQDSRYDHNYNTLWGRLKHAGKALFGKPVYYNDVYLDSTEAFDALLNDMRELRDWTACEKR